MVEVRPGGVTITGGRTIDAERIVVATEGPAAAELIDIEPVESNPATAVWYATPTATRPHPLDTASIILDGTGSGPALNLAAMSTVAPTYAPPGRGLVVAACPGVLDADVEPRVRAQLIAVFGSRVVDEFEPLRVDTIAHGQPRQHPPFSPKQRIDLGDGLFVCGDHRDTASLQGALYSGRRCGEAVVESLH